MTVQLCEKCALCLPCKARLGAVLVGDATPGRARLSSFLRTAVEVGAAGAAAVATVSTAAALAESTLDQIAEAMGLEEPKRRRRRRKRLRGPPPST